MDSEETFGEQPEDKVVDLAEAVRTSVGRSGKGRKSGGSSKKSSSRSKSSTRKRAG